jgi:hypothetical protein
MSPFQKDDWLPAASGSQVCWLARTHLEHVPALDSSQRPVVAEQYVGWLSGWRFSQLRTGGRAMRSEGENSQVGDSGGG